MKYTKADWIKLHAAWIEANKDFDLAYDYRQTLFEKAKTWLGCHKELGNMSIITEMIEREIGKATLKEQK